MSWIHGTLKDHNAVHKAINEYNAAERRVHEAKRALETKRERLIALLQNYPSDTPDPAIRHHILCTEGRQRSA